MDATGSKEDRGNRSNHPDKVERIGEVLKDIKPGDIISMGDIEERLNERYKWSPTRQEIAYIVRCNYGIRAGTNLFRIKWRLPDEKEECGDSPPPEETPVEGHPRQ